MSGLRPHCIIKIKGADLDGEMNCASARHQSPGLWRHPEDESEVYKDLDYWVELAKTLE